MGGFLLVFTHTIIYIHISFNFVINIQKYNTSVQPTKVMGFFNVNFFYILSDVTERTFFVNESFCIVVGECEKPNKFAASN